MWSKDLVKLLIIKYQDNEHLYNTHHPMYLDRNKRSITYNEIHKELKKIKKDITLEQMKKKIHCLRSQYIKELHEVNSKQSTDAFDDIVPKLWCFNKLEFLKPYVKNSDFCNVVNDNSEKQDNCSELSNEPEIEISHFKRKTNFNLEERVDNIKTLLTARLLEKKEYDWLGKQVVFEINTLKDESLKRDTVWKIQSILRDAYLMDNEPSSQECNNVFQY